MQKKLWNRDFILLLQGNAVSTVGDLMYSVAIGYWVYEKTGSSGLMGIFLWGGQIEIDEKGALLNFQRIAQLTQTFLLHFMLFCQFLPLILNQQALTFQTCEAYITATNGSNITFANQKYHAEPCETIQAGRWGDRKEERGCLWEGFAV